MSEDDDVEENEDEDDNAEDEVEDDKVADYKKEGDDDVEKEEVDHAPHALFESADMSQEPFYAKIDKKNTAGQDRAARLVRACAVDMHMDMSQEHAEIYRQNGARPRSWAHVLCEPAQSKCTWTCHNQEPCFADIYRHKCAPQQLGARFVRACTVDMYMDMSQENAEICRQNGAPQKLGARFVRACAVEMHMDMSQSRAMSCRNLQAQARAPAVRRTFCASLRNQNAHRHVT